MFAIVKSLFGHHFVITAASREHAEATAKSGPHPLEIVGEAATHDGAVEKASALNGTAAKMPAPESQAQPPAIVEVKAEAREA